MTSRGFGRGDRGRGYRGDASFNSGGRGAFAGRADRRGYGGDRGRGRGRGATPVSIFRQDGAVHEPSQSVGRGDFAGRADRRGYRGDRGRGRGRGATPVSIFRQDGAVHEPCQSVRSLEDEILKPSTEAALRKLEIGSCLIPVRPAYGTQGEPLTLWTNYFELQPAKDQVLIRYSLDIKNVDKKEEVRGPKRARLVALLLENIPQTSSAIASDFASTLITTKTLGFESQDFLISYFAETEAGPSDRSPRYTIKVQFDKTFRLGEMVGYLTDTNIAAGVPESRGEIMQALNIIVAHGMKSDTSILSKPSRSGSGKYFPTSEPLLEQKSLVEGLRALRGFFASVRAGTGRLLLNVQVKHIAVWEDFPLPDVINAMENAGIPTFEIGRRLNGVFVHATHLNNRLKKIHGFARLGDGQGPHKPRVTKNAANSKELKFWKEAPAPAPGLPSISAAEPASEHRAPSEAAAAPEREAAPAPEPGKWITVADHFEEAQGTPLRMPELPVINVGTPQRPIYMPPEFCIIKQQQDYRGKLSPSVTAAMIRFAVRKAPANAATIAGNGLRMLQQNSEPVLKSFGIQLPGKMLTVQARQIPGVDPLYHEATPVQTAEGSWNMKGMKLTEGAQVPAWTYLLITTRAHPGEIRTVQDAVPYINDFHKAMSDHGINAPGPMKPLHLGLQDAKNPGPEIEAFFRPLDFGAQGAPRLLLVLLPFNSAPIYNAVKRMGDITHGVQTVVCIADRYKFARRGNIQYYANVLLKINLKFGGQNQILAATDLDFISEGVTMVVGMDVTHPAPGSAKKAPSISSIVASVDKSLSLWPADVNIQTERKEMIEGLKEMIKGRLNLWRDHNSNLPEEILIYRDGVGDSQFNLVLEHELPQIRQACADMYPASTTKESKPYVSIIICGKRHNTRFYPTDEKEADSGNSGTRSGTVVDRGVTEARVWEFYIQAHKAIQGTARPAHYTVILDEIFLRRARNLKVENGPTAEQLAANMVERLTHNMCYMFGRATKAVSICPPAYHADLVCDRARRWLSHIFDERELSIGTDVSARSVDVAVHPRIKNTMFYI